WSRELCGRRSRWQSDLGGPTRVNDLRIISRSRTGRRTNACAGATDCTFWPWTCAARSSQPLGTVKSRLAYSLTTLRKQLVHKRSDRQMRSFRSQPYGGRASGKVYEGWANSESRTAMIINQRLLFLIIKIVLLLVFMAIASADAAAQVWTVIAAKPK